MAREPGLNRTRVRHHCRESVLTLRHNAALFASACSLLCASLQSNANDRAAGSRPALQGTPSHHSSRSPIDLRGAFRSVYSYVSQHIFCLSTWPMFFYPALLVGSGKSSSEVVLGEQQAHAHINTRTHARKLTQCGLSLWCFHLSTRATHTCKRTAD